MAKGGIGRGMKKGQGLPLNLIVIAAIAVLILVLVIAFSTGALGKLFGSTKTFVDVASPEELSTFRIRCEQTCFAARQLANTVAKFENSDYCVNYLPNDTEKIRCWQPGVNVDCKYNITLPEGQKTCEGTGTAGSESCTCT